MSFHPEVLDPAQREMLRQMGPVMTRRQFYLGGGTAVAIHLGHRCSDDLDWFTETPMTDALHLAQALRDEGLAFVTGSVARGALHGAVGGVRVSFLEYRYPLLQPASTWPEYSCRLASLDDLACMKLSAVAQRGSKKDFVDIYALGLRHRPLDELLTLYQKRFAVGDIGHVLYGLSYFDDADQEPMPRLKGDLAWETVKVTIQNWVKEWVGPP